MDMYGSNPHFINGRSPAGRKRSSSMWSAIVQKAWVLPKPFKIRANRCSSKWLDRFHPTQLRSLLVVVVGMVIAWTYYNMDGQANQIIAGLSTSCGVASSPSSCVHGSCSVSTSQVRRSHIGAHSSENFAGWYLQSWD